MPELAVASAEMMAVGQLYIDAAVLAGNTNIPDGEVKEGLRDAFSEAVTALAQVSFNAEQWSAFVVERFSTSYGDVLRGETPDRNPFEILAARLSRHLLELNNPFAGPALMFVGCLVDELVPTLGALKNKGLREPPPEGLDQTVRAWRLMTVEIVSWKLAPRKYLDLKKRMQVQKDLRRRFGMH